MNKVIRIRIRKDLDSRQHKNILELKGSLIAQGYTDIIHINDEDEEFYINSFTTTNDKAKEVLNYVENVLEARQLSTSAWLL